MVEVNPATIIVLFALVIFAAAIVAWLAEPAKYTQSRTHVFIAALTGLGLITISFVYYLSMVRLGQHQRRLFVIAETARLHKLAAGDVQEALASAAAVVPGFVASLMPGVGDAGAALEDEPVGLRSGGGRKRRGRAIGGEAEIAGAAFPAHVREAAARRAVSAKIFTLWEELLVADGYVDLDESGYLASFLQYAASAELAAEWAELKFTLNAKTRKFGDLLFEYAAGKGGPAAASAANAGDNSPPRPRRGEAYARLAEALMADERYKEL